MAGKQSDQSAQFVVQSLWIGDRLSTMGRLGVQSFLNAGADYHLYCYDQVSDVPAGTTLKDAAEILSHDQVFPYKDGFGAGSYSAGSNYFRYKLLLDRGGWWVDTDVVCLQPFDFTAESVIASEQRDRRERGADTGAASSVIRQPAGSALMRWTWRACRERERDSVRWGEVGPRLLDEGVRALGWQEDLAPTQAFSPVPFYDWQALIDPARIPSFGTDTYAVHLWHQMWRAGGVDPDGTFPESCLYEQLKRSAGLR
jgi:hypothetical protein